MQACQARLCSAGNNRRKQCSYEDIADFEKALEDRLDLLAPALHIDTGMNRLGFEVEEAVELAKTFGGTDGHKYVNGVLDKLAGSLRATEIAAGR